MSIDTAIPAKPASILFVKPDSAGDLILFAPMLSQLRRFWPETRIGLLMLSKFRDVAPLLPPEVITVFTPAHPSDDNALNSPHCDELAREVARFAPEILVAASYDKNWIHGQAAAAAPEARRISLGPASFDKGTEHHFRRLGITEPADLFPERIAVSRELAEFEKANALLRHLCGADAPPATPRITVPPSALAEAQARLAELQLNSKGFVICNPAGIAHVDIKAWPAGFSAEVVVWLETKQRLPVLICAHQDEKAVVDRFLQEIEPSLRPRVWLGKPGQFAVMAGLLAHARAYFGNDTSTLHVAEAVGTPVAGIFGGGTWPRFRPIDRRSIAIVHPLPCFGCGWDCHFGDAPCIKLIKPSDVIGVLEPWLSGTDAAGDGSRTVEVAHLAAGELDAIRRSREIHDRLVRDSAARLGQILELTDLARRSENDVIALNAATAGLQADVLTLHAQIALSTATGKRIAVIESELSSYREENDRLARELTLARRVLGCGGAENDLPALKTEPLRLPRPASAGDDILFSIDRFETGDRLVHVSGWAFCPRIDCDRAVVVLLFEGPDQTWMATPEPMVRPDIATAFAQANLGPALPVGAPGRQSLGRSGFSGLWEHARLGKGSSWALTLQIDGPEFSVRKATGLTLHG